MIEGRNEMDAGQEADRVKRVQKERKDARKEETNKGHEERNPEK